MVVRVVLRIGVIGLGVVVGCGAGVQPPAPAAPAACDNFVHDPGTRTGAPGLGHVEKRGSGPVPLILIPGAAFDWTVWEGFMTRNANRYTMYAVTPAGYGGTPPPPMPADVEDFAGMAWTRGVLDGIVGLIERERLDRPVLVAHHYMADAYALRLALDHPGLVRGVVGVAGRGCVQMSALPREAGAPVKFADASQRADSTKRYIAPMYRGICAEMWRTGSFQARLFCRDEARAAALFEQQVSVPRSTQIRYMLEYHHLDVNRELEGLRVPLLVVEPRGEPLTFEGLLSMNEKLYVQMCGDMETARAQMGRQLDYLWGDRDIGARRMFDPSVQWEELAGRVPGMRRELVADTGIFIMEDQPQRLDELVAGFVAGCR